MKDKNKFDIALVAPPWWLIPSKNTITATEHIVEDYGFNFNKYGYKSVIFSRERDYTDKYGIKDVNKYNNKYIYTKVSIFDRRLLKKTNTLLFYLIYILNVAIKIRKLEIKKIIIFQTFSFCYWIKILNPRAKVLFYTVNHELSRDDNYYKYGFISNKLAKRVFPRLHAIIAMSKYIKKGIQNRFPHIRNKCKVVYIGIDKDIFKEKVEKNKNKIITYAGRIVPEKGVHLLSTAFKNLQKEFKDIKLYILGADIGPNIPKDYFENFNYQGMKLFGVLPRKIVAKILRESSIFVYPVIWEEPFGLAPVEAIFVGIPTVISNTKSGYKEVINENNAYYFESNNEKDLEKILRKLLNSNQDQGIIYNKGIETLRRKMSWENCIKNTITCFNSFS